MNKLTSELLKDNVARAYLTAKEQGFYPEETTVTHCLMMIITEIGEVIQADRKGRCCTQKPDLCLMEHYKEEVEDTVESELADVAICILSLIGHAGSKNHNNLYFQENDIISYHYDVGKTLLHGTLTEDLFFIVEFIMQNDVAHSPLWLVMLKLQEVLSYLFAIAHNRGIDLSGHIRLKMLYNEHREYKHGCKY